MPVLVGYANGNKYYYNSEGSGGATIEVPEEGVDSGVSSTLVFNTLEEEMAYYGMTPEEIQNVMNKINGVSSLESNPKPATITDPKTGNTTTNPNGSLVSNSAQSLKNTTEFQKATIEIEKQKLQAMNTQNEIQKKQLDLMDYNLIMQSQIYSQLADLNANLNKQTTAISNQNLSPTFQAGQTSINIDTKAIADSTNATNQALAQSITAQINAIANQTNVIKTAEDAKLVEMKNHIEAVRAQKFDASFGDVSVTMNTEVLNANTQKTAEAIEKIAQANEKIALGQENQIQTNTKIVENIAKKNEHLDYLKNGDATIKDSNGNVIKPREVEAKKNAEQLIEQSDTNNTTFDDIADFVGEALGTVQEGLENALGSTDGFDLDFNPMSYVDNILKTDMEEYIEKLKKS